MAASRVFLTPSNTALICKTSGSVSVKRHRGNGSKRMERVVSTCDHQKREGRQSDGCTNNTYLSEHVDIIVLHRNFLFQCPNLPPNLHTLRDALQHGNQRTQNAGHSHRALNESRKATHMKWTPAPKSGETWGWGQHASGGGSAAAALTQARRVGEWPDQLRDRNSPGSGSFADNSMITKRLVGVGRAWDVLQGWMVHASTGANVGAPPPRDTERHG